MDYSECQIDNKKNGCLTRFSKRNQSGAKTIYKITNFPINEGSSCIGLEIGLKSI